ncbi:MAG: LLM class flavin-dependent oxidoreductase, partial [Alphaproteobacteria bacterium]
MRLGIVHLPVALPGEGAPMPRLRETARRVEDRGLAGLWMTDSVGRGPATLDPLIALSAAAAVTERIEIGTCVLQIPIRPPVDAAHRVRSLDAITGGRLRLGVGTGSTQADFNLFGADYEARFRTLPDALERMRAAWRGEAVNGATLSAWPGLAAAPPILLGAWRSRRWIERAAQNCDGWLASGIHSSWEDLARGIAIYRAAGGRRAAVANVSVDLRPEPVPTALAAHSKITLVCPLDEARRRLGRLADLG